MGFRSWSVFIFPINWSFVSHLWLPRLALLLLGIGYCLLILSVSVERRRLVFALGFCIVALLPVAHLALLNSTLLGARVYHLSLIGLALAWGTVAQELDKNASKRILLFVLVGSEMLILVHNLLIWRNTAKLAGQACKNFGDQISQGVTVSIQDLPRSHNGVFFLSNDFADCVLVNSGKRISVISDSVNGSKDPNITNYKWDDASLSIVRAR